MLVLSCTRIVNYTIPSSFFLPSPTDLSLSLPSPLPTGMMGLSGFGPNASQQTSVEELLAFIEGEGGSGTVTPAESVPSAVGGGGKTASKKGKKKTKKPVSPVLLLAIVNPIMLTAAASGCVQLP